MVLWVDFDAAYLILPNACSRFAGHYYLLSDHLPNANLKDFIPHLNRLIHIECKIIQNVVSSVVAAETTGLFGNAQSAIIICCALIELGHPQLPTPLKMDNSTANNFVHANFCQRKSKTWDMRYHWLRDRELLKQIRIYWDRGSNNNADYFTKHHPTSHHKEQQPRYILKGFHINN